MIYCHFKFIYCSMFLDILQKHIVVPVIQLRFTALNIFFQNNKFSDFIVLMKKLISKHQSLKINFDQWLWNFNNTIAWICAQEEEILKTRKRWMALKSAKMIIKFFVLEIYIAPFLKKCMCRLSYVVKMFKV